MKNAHYIHIAAALAAAIATPHAAAQNQWPNKPIRMTVSSGAKQNRGRRTRLKIRRLTAIR